MEDRRTEVIASRIHIKLEPLDNEVEVSTMSFYSACFSVSGPQLFQLECNDRSMAEYSSQSVIVIRLKLFCTICRHQTTDIQELGVKACMLSTMVASLRRFIPRSQPIEFKIRGRGFIANG